VGGEGIVRGAVLPGASPVGVNKTFEAARVVGLEGEAVVLGFKEITTDSFDSGCMGLLGFVAKAGTLLNSHGEIGANHGLEVAKTANDGAVVPGVGVWGSIRITVEEMAIVSGGVM
jgi:hypothetical protein